MVWTKDERKAREIERDVKASIAWQERRAEKKAEEDKTKRLREARLARESSP
jgi:hypothetical protein